MSHQPKAIFATLPRTQRGAAIVLGGDPKGKNFLYTNGNSVIIRDIANPSLCDIYTEHSQQTTVAKYSPSGFYIASGDISGKIRIWDTVNKEHVLKNEFQPLGGPIKDIAWTSDNKWMVAVGEGRDRFGAAFNAEMGSTIGEIMGQSKPLNSVDFSPVRPFKVVTASEDNTVAFFDDRPLKFKFTHSDHTRFVNTVRYSPDGSVFASGGADGLIFIYDGKTGEKKMQLGEPAHKGGIYGVCFSPDSKSLMSSSGDKTVKIWDIEANTSTGEISLGSQVEDMQLGCLWQGDFLLSVSLSGYINYIDRNETSKPSRIIKGHNKPITAMAISEDHSTIFTASSDGGTCHWNAKTGDNDMLEGKGHSNQVQMLSVCEDSLVSCGMDDSVVFSSVSQKKYGQKVKVPSQPRGVAVAKGNMVAVACINEVLLMNGPQVVFSHKVDWEPQCADFSTDKAELAVGGAKDNKVHVFRVAGSSLTELKTLDHGGGVMDVKYSPDGKYLAACDTYRKVILYSLPDYTPLTSTEWSHHTARVNTLAWTPDSGHLASGALDTNLVIWTPLEKMKHIMIKGAHAMSQITRVGWLDGNTLVSVGQDSNVRHWTVNY